MRINRLHFRAMPRASFHRRENGSAVIVIIILISIILVYIAGNIRTMRSLGRDLKLIEKQQIRRLAPTNSPALVSSSLPQRTRETGSVQVVNSMD